MTDPASLSAGGAPMRDAPQRPTRTPAFERRLAKRYRAERLFNFMGISAIAFSMGALVFLISTMLTNGIPGFQRAELAVEIDFAQARLDVSAAELDSPAAMRRLEDAGLPQFVDASALRSLGPDAAVHVYPDAWRSVAGMLIRNPDMINRSTVMNLPASSDLAMALDGEGPAQTRALARQLRSDGKLADNWDWGFFTRSDATSPQMAGIWGALKGSVLTMLVCFSLAFPVGMFAALYLEEYAPRNRWTDIIEVSINNLAAVPSIIFGLLGLVTLSWLFPFLRSTPLIGGITLALMTMPVIVIASRNAVKAVPQSVRDAALAVGASPVQVVFHHVVPLALPGMLTGTIIGMARALGETAPLILIGMRAFVASPPDTLSSAATVLPMQIFLWSDEIDRGFVERTSAAIIVLLVLLLAMNAVAIHLRTRFERRR